MSTPADALPAITTRIPTRVPAVVLAGQDPGRTDPLAAAEGTPYKALVTFAGAPLVVHAVHALAQSPRVGEIAVVGLPPDVQPEFGVPVHRLAGRGGMLDNAQAGVEFFAPRAPGGYVLVCGGDAPLLSAQAVTWFLDACHPPQGDIYWAIAARPTVESAFPGARRSWLRTADGAFCSADLFLARAGAAHAADAPLRAALARRKRPLALVRMVGLGWTLRLLLGRARVPGLVGRVQELFGVSLRVVELPFPGAAMDVDKPEHLALLRDYVARRAKDAAP